MYLWFLTLVIIVTLSQTNQWIIWTFPFIVVTPKARFLCLGKQMFVCANDICYWLGLPIHLHIDDTAAVFEQHQG